MDHTDFKPQPDPYQPTFSDFVKKGTPWTFMECLAHHGGTGREKPWAMFQYSLRCLIVKCTEVSKPSLPKQLLHFRTIILFWFCHFDALQDLRIRHLIGYWNGLVCAIGWGLWWIQDLVEVEGVWVSLSEVYQVDLSCTDLIWGNMNIYFHFASFFNAAMMWLVSSLPPRASYMSQ